MKLPWHMARNLNRIGGSMKRAQEICRGRERVTPSYLLKITKFLLKVSQFELFVMTEKNIFVYELFLSLNISDFSYLLYM